MPKPSLDHPRLMAGLTAVARASLEACAADGVPVHDDVRAAVALVESWLAGAPTTAAQLEAAQGKAYAPGEAANRTARTIGGGAQWKDGAAERALLHRAGHLSVAVGNLCYKAQKERDWQELGTVMDSASYAWPAGAEVLKKLRVKASVARAAPPKVTAAPKPARAAAKDLAPFIGAKSAASAVKLGARRDPTRVLAPDALRALLQSKGYPHGTALDVFDARFGGLTLEDDDDKWIFGAAVCAQSDAHVAPRGGRTDLVPVAYANDLVFFLDMKGSAWAEDTIEDPVAAPFAASGDDLVAKLIARLVPAPKKRAKTRTQPRAR